LVPRSDQEAILETSEQGSYVLPQLNKKQEISNLQSYQICTAYLELLLKRRDCLHMNAVNFYVILMINGKNHHILFHSAYQLSCIQTSEYYQCMLFITNYGHVMMFHSAHATQSFQNMKCRRQCEVHLGSSSTSKRIV